MLNLLLLAEPCKIMNTDNYGHSGNHYVHMHMLLFTCIHNHISKFSAWNMQDIKNQMLYFKLPNSSWKNNSLAPIQPSRFGISNLYCIPFTWKINLHQFVWVNSCSLIIDETLTLTGTRPGENCWLCRPMWNLIGPGVPGVEPGLVGLSLWLLELLK